jgi:hypothetical protein
LPTLSFGESVLLGLLTSSLGGFFNSGTTFASTLGRK